MEVEPIVEVGIDDEGRLFLRPSSTSFDYVYPAGMGVQWDAVANRLFYPKPTDGSYLRCYGQVVAAADEYGVRLTITPITTWSNVPDQLRTAISETAG